MKHIVVFNSGFLPAQTFGGPVVSINNIIQNLNTEFKFTIITSAFEIDGQTPLNPKIKVNELNYFSENVEVLYLDKKHYHFQYVIKKMIGNKRIDLIYVNSFFNYSQLRLARKIERYFKIPLIVAPRGELEPNALALKKIKKISYLNIFKLLYKNDCNIYYQATTTEEKNNIKSLLNVSESKIIILENLPTKNSNEASILKNKEKDNLEIVFISRIQTKKNLSFALDILNKLNNKKLIIRFDIFGPIENVDYWENCLKKIQALPSNITVNYKGIVNHEQIFNTFSNYDLFFFPTLSENFGHVIYEALAANCPILISDQTPWTDVNEYNAGKAFNLDDSEKFIKYIEQLAIKDNEDYKIIRKSVKEYLQDKINTKETVNTYLRIFKSIINRN